MATLRDIQRKIGAVKKTRQITKAMDMVAASRLRSTQGKMESFDPYAKKFAEVLGNLAARIEPDIHPLLVKKEKVSRVELLHFTADRGLCGSFNMNSINRAAKWLAEEKASGVSCSLTLVGKKGRDFFRKRNEDITESFTNIYGTVEISFINKMTRQFINRYLADEIDEAVHAVFEFCEHGQTATHAGEASSHRTAKDRRGRCLGPGRRVPIRTQCRGASDRALAQTHQRSDLQCVSAE